jgi:hypothetical protein
LILGKGIQAVLYTDKKRRFFRIINKNLSQDFVTTLFKAMLIQMIIINLRTAKIMIIIMKVLSCRKANQKPKIWYNRSILDRKWTKIKIKKSKRLLILTKSHLPFHIQSRDNRKHWSIVAKTSQINRNKWEIRYNYLTKMIKGLFHQYQWKKIGNQTNKLFLLSKRF